MAASVLPVEGLNDAGAVFGVHAQQVQDDRPHTPAFQACAGFDAAPQGGVDPTQGVIFHAVILHIDLRTAGNWRSLDHLDHLLGAAR